VYDVPHEAWNDTYQDGIYDLIVMDEFNGQKTITQMNLLTDGYVTPLQRRGTNPYLKKDKLPVIICANKYPHEVYHNVKDRTLVEAFASRYQVLDFYNAQHEDNWEGMITLKFTTASNEAVLLPSDDEDDCVIVQGTTSFPSPMPVPVTPIPVKKRKANFIDVDMSFTDPENDL